MTCTWTEIAKRISIIEGKPISRARCQQVANKALKKLKVTMSKDPVFLALLEDLEIGVERDHK